MANAEDHSAAGKSTFSQRAEGDRGQAGKDWQVKGSEKLKGFFSGEKNKPRPGETAI